MGKTKRSRLQVIEAITGSGGIKKVIADRLGVARNTVDNYLDRWVSAREVYEDECAVNADLAESIVITNLRIQRKRQSQGEDGTEVDTSDAKWYLAHKGRDRGYAQTRRHEVEMGEEVVFKVQYEDGDA